MRRGVGTPLLPNTVVVVGSDAPNTGAVTPSAPGMVPCLPSPLPVNMLPTSPTPSDASLR